MKNKLGDRGRAVEVLLSKPIILNSIIVERVLIEIDHINYGLCERTQALNSKKRTSFTVKDIEKFIYLLDGEDLFPVEYRGSKSRFALRVDCPIKGKFEGREFRMIFETDYKLVGKIHTITLIPNW